MKSIELDEYINHDPQIVAWLCRNPELIQESLMLWTLPGRRAAARGPDSLRGLARTATARRLRR